METIFFLVILFLVLVLFSKTSDLRRQLGRLEVRVGELRDEVSRLAGQAARSPARPAAPVVQERAPAPQVPAGTVQAEPVPAPIPPPVAPQAIPSPHRQEPPVAPPPPSPVEPHPTASASAPPPPIRRHLEWEALLGLHGAAWLGALAFLISAILLARYSLEQGWITEPLRVALILLAGAASLVGSELGLRRGYAVTANALCGGGVAVLYAGFYAAHGLYDLIPLLPTFFFMALITLVACLLSLRHNSTFIALLGLLGGFATPLVLAGEADRPLGLFSYILLLNLGLLTIALRRGWHGLATWTLGGTLVVQFVWFSKRVSPEKVPLALGIFLVFALLYLALPWAARGKRDTSLAGVSLVGGLAPFVFALYLASAGTYAGQWPLLFGFVGCLSLALIVMGERRSEPVLLVGGSLGATVTILLWAGQALDSCNVWGATAAAMALGGLFNLLPRLRGRGILRPEGLAGSASEPMGAWRADSAPAQLAALVAAGGLGIYGAVMSDRGLGEPPWIFFLLLAGLFLLVLERARWETLGSLLTWLGPALMALLVQQWFFLTTGADTLPRNLALPVLLALAWSVVASLRWEGGPALSPSSAAWEWGAVASAFIALFGLLLLCPVPPLGREPLPLFTALLLLLVLLAGSALRRNWTAVLPAGLGLSALIASGWHLLYGRTTDVGLVLPVYALLYLGFLAFPFLVPGASAAVWKRQLWPWLASALAGPAFFPVIWRTVVLGWGDALSGVLALAMAAVSAAALARMRREFAVEDKDPESLSRRTRALALYGAVALGFLTLAVPLQLKRQWITVAWALEGAAVWWLYRRVPHPGLKYFGAFLYGAVVLRLLVNPWIAEPGPPIFNWLLYTYGLVAASLLLGAFFLKPVEADRLGPLERGVFLEGKLGLAPAAAFTALILIFALINLEIADYFSPRHQAGYAQGPGYARHLTASLAWAVYALALLVIGMWRHNQALRFISLGFMVLAVGKVFLYDLASLTGLWRVLSFLALAVSLVLVSLLYQRFVFKRAMKEPADSGQQYFGGQR